MKKMLLSLDDKIDDLIRLIAAGKKWNLNTVVSEAVSLYAQDQGFTDKATEAEQAQPGVDYDPNGSMCEDDYNYFKKAVQK